MGTVIAAFDTVLRRDVAVKLLAGARSRDPAARNQLLDEARTIARLSHPNIVRVLEVDVAAGCIVMELVRGESLAARLERGDLAPAELRHIALQLLDGLEAAHRASVFHCDVKPANVLLEDDGTVRLADFGVARLADAGGHHVAGTPGYMAPECFDGKVDVRTDLYALGATLFRCATGQLVTHVTDPVARASALRTKLRDRALEVAILRTLERDPTRRPQSAASLRALLTPPRPRRRRWWLPATALAIVLVLVAGWFVAGRARSRTRPLPIEGPVALLPLVDRTGDPALAFAPAGVPYLIGLDLASASDVEIVDYYRLRASVDGAASPAAWEAKARALGARTALEVTADRRATGVHVVLRLRSLTESSIELGRAEADAAAADVSTVARRLARELLRVGPSAASTVRPGEVELALAVSALERHALEDAELTVGRALAASPDWPEAHYVAAVIGWWRGSRDDRVLAHARAARDGAITPARRAFLDGLMLLVGDQYQVATEHLRGAAALYPNDRDLRYGLFEALWHSGQGAEAMAEYAKLVTIAPRFQLGLDHVCAWAFAHGDERDIALCIERADAVEYPDRPLLRTRAAIARHETLPSDALSVSDTAALGAAAFRHAEVLALIHATRFDAAALRRAVDALPPAGERDEDRALVQLGVALVTNAPAATLHALRETARARMIAHGTSHVIWLRYLAVELALPDDDHQDAILDAFAQTHESDVRTAVAEVLAAAQRGDGAFLEAARTSSFEEARELATGLVAMRRGELAAAGFAFDRAAARSIDGRFMLHERFLEASAWHALGDAARTHAACAEIVRPRVLDWSWTVFVRPCLVWTGDRAALAALSR
jgi:eukaryotic-like serine/threonine-protein kinase